MLLKECTTTIACRGERQFTRSKNGSSYPNDITLHYKNIYCLQRHGEFLCTVVDVFGFQVHGQGYKAPISKDGPVLNHGRRYLKSILDDPSLLFTMLIFSIISERINT